MIAQPKRGKIHLLVAGLFALLVFMPMAALAGSAEIDAFAYRQRVGEAALKREINELTAGGKAYRLGPSERDRLWRLQLAVNAADPEDYGTQVRKVLLALDAARAEVLALKAGHYPASDVDSRWIKAARMANDPDAKALFERVYLDQHWPSVEVSPSQQDALDTLYIGEQLKIITANTAWLKTVLAKIGWFDIRLYGEDASQAAWLLVQHADNDPAWQEEVLRRLPSRVQRGDMQGKFYAFLVDRVEHNAGRPQVYGTQGACGAGGWEPFQTVNPETLDLRRSSLGLPTESAYRELFKCHQK